MTRQQTDDEVTIPEGYGMKAVRDVTIGDEGKVSAVVANFDEVDNDGEVIVSGSIAEGMKATASFYSHDTVMGFLLGTGLPDAPPVAKGVIKAEGKQAVVHLDYFMETQRGREAFATVKAMGPDQAWSFTFRKEAVALPSDEWKAKGAYLMLTRLGPLLDGAMEVSPVKQAAAKRSGTISAKAADLETKPPEIEDAPAPVQMDPAVEARVRRVLQQIRR